MRVTLLHNTSAGHDGPSKAELVRILERADHEVDDLSTTNKEWLGALEDPGDLVVVAGGDGTVARVASVLAGRGVPIAILPIGTANNIATSLGVAGPPESIVAGWRSACRRRFDVGVVSGPWGEARFLEAVGLGLFTQSMAMVEALDAQDEPRGREAELARDLGFLRMTLDAMRANRWHLTLDGEDLSGEYLLLEVMNAPCFGPNLCLAPAADPGDGRLDLVLLEEHHRARFAEYLQRLRQGERPEPGLPVRRGRRVQLRWDGAPLHVDSDVYADASISERKDEVVIDVRLDSEVELLVGTR